MRYIKCLQCTEEAFSVPANIPLCYNHLIELRSALGVITNQIQLTQISGSVVYYLGRADTDLVKIGVTQNLHKRLRSISSTSRPVHVLATEPGGYYLERKRHHQFRSLRNAGSEWFRKAPVLEEHISVLISEHGVPHCNCPASSGRHCPVSDRN